MSTPPKTLAEATGPRQLDYAGEPLPVGESRDSIEDRTHSASSAVNDERPHETLLIPGIGNLQQLRDMLGAPPALMFTSPPCESGCRQPRDGKPS